MWYECQNDTSQFNSQCINNDEKFRIEQPLTQNLVYGYTEQQVLKGSIKD